MVLISVQIYIYTADWICHLCTDELGGRISPAVNIGARKISNQDDCGYQLALTQFSILDGHHGKDDATLHDIDRATRT